MDCTCAEFPSSTRRRYIKRLANSGRSVPTFSLPSGRVLLTPGLPTENEKDSAVEGRLEHTDMRASPCTTYSMLSRCVLGLTSAAEVVTCQLCTSLADHCLESSGYHPRQAEWSHINGRAVLESGCASVWCECGHPISVSTADPSFETITPCRTGGVCERSRPLVADLDREMVTHIVCTKMRYR